MSKKRQRVRAGTTKVDEVAPLIRSLSLRLPAGYRVPSHVHGWAQVVYAARGVLLVEAKAKQWVVPPLRCVWMGAGVEHGVETRGETWMRTVYVRPDVAAGVAGETRVLDVSPLMRELVLEVVRVGLLDERNGVHWSLAAVLMDQLVRARELGLALPLPADDRARVVADRVRREPGGVALLTELARGTGASARTIERAFLKETGLTFGRWRQQARLQHAARLLAEREAVTNVALDCGYESVSAFVAMFKRAMGVTPGAYVRGDANAE